MLDRWVADTIGAEAPLTREALERWQLARLRETAAYARENSAFYRARLPAGEISSFADFAALPMTTADDLRAHGLQMLCVSPDSIARVVSLTTSGSTGKPKRVFFTQADQERTIDYFRHGMGEFVRPGSRVVSLFPGDSPGSLNDLLRQGLERMDTELRLTGYPTPDRYEAVLRMIADSGADALVGPASAVGGLARSSAGTEVGETLAAQVESVLLAAEYVSAADRTDIGRLWRCRVNEHYSMTETGLAGAVGCVQPGGYHVWEAGLYYEVVDPRTGAVLPDGALGELVVTTLTREGMPMIRYRTGDHSRFLTGRCACGSVLRRLERVRARPQKKKFAPRTIPDTLGEG